MNQIKVTGCINCPFPHYNKGIYETVCTAGKEILIVPTTGIHKDCPLKKEPVTISLDVVESKPETDITTGEQLKQDLGKFWNADMNEIYKPISNILWKFYPGIVIPEIELLNKIREAVHEVDANWQKVTGHRVWRLR
jgi:hypothetical protein